MAEKARSVRGRRKEVVLGLVVLAEVMNLNLEMKQVGSEVEDLMLG